MKKGEEKIIVTTEWRCERNSKLQIKEGIEKLIQENIEDAKVKDCYKVNKD
jgi:hypothetical protein